MEEGAKRRLVGTAVAVVLLVIFLPILLEEDASNPVSEQEMSVPPRPDFEQGYDASVGEGPVEPSASSIPDSRELIPRMSTTPRELPPSALFEAPPTAEPEYIPDYEILPEPDSELLPESGASPVPPGEEPPIAKPKPPATTPPAPVAKKPAPEPKPAPTPKPKPKPAPASKPQPAQPSTPAQASANASWVIQVASLQERPRAYALVQDLRAKGFPAYLEEAIVKQVRWHRIRIGPERGRRQIESMAALLEARTGLRGQIQSYP